MRLINRSGALLVLLLLGTVVLWMGWQDAKEQYLAPWFGEQLARQVEKRFGLRLNYRSIATNLFSETDLYTVRLEPASFTIPSSTVAVLADRIHFTYTPLGLLRGRLRRLEVEHCRIQAGKTQIALSISQTGDLMVIECPPQRLALQDLRSVFSLPSHLNLQGLTRLEGEWLLKKYRSHLMQMRIQGDVLRVSSGSSWNARVHSRLELNGPAVSPSLEGTVVLNQGVWRGVGTFAALGAKKTEFLDLLNRFPGMIDVRLTGEGFWIQTDQLRAQVRSDLRVRKEKAGRVRFVGTLHSLNGNYTVKRRRFNIREGTVIFPETGGAPRLDALLETRVKRYKIFASVQGTLDDSSLRLSSKPELSRENILSLLTFERTLDQLDPKDRDQVVQQDAERQALNLLFLGRVEAIASRLLGVDEINVNVAPKMADEVSHSPIESVEIGKYVISDKLFGSYKLEPGKILGETPKHSVGADYQVTDSLAVGLAVGRGGSPEQKESLAQNASQQQKPEAEEALVRFRWRF